MSFEEKKRIDSLLAYEKECQKLGYSLVAGTDEVGRGPLAGPVVAAACILLPEFYVEGIKDSKKLTHEKRFEIYQQLTTSKTCVFSISIVENQTIDQINILQASLLAMKQSIDTLKKKPDYILVDGTHYPNVDLPGKCIVKGDSFSLSIAAASILAKVQRDEIMNQAHRLYPEYSFDSNKGYPTKAHLIALKKYGPCPIHRKSFRPVAAASSPSFFHSI